LSISGQIDWHAWFTFRAWRTLALGFQCVDFYVNTFFGTPSGTRKASTWWNSQINLQLVKKTRFLFLKTSSKKNKRRNMKSWWRDSSVIVSNRTASTDLVR